MGTWLSVDSYRPLSLLLYPRPVPVLDAFYSTGGHYVTIGRSRVWQFEPRENRRPNLVVLFCHGNATDVTRMYAWLTAMADAIGVIILAWEYPGYGGDTQGTPCAASICQAAEDAFDVITSASPETQVVIVGHSVGSGPACHLARVRAGQRIHAMVLISPFVTIGRVAGDSLHWSLYYLCPAFYDNMAAMATLCVPVLFIHGLRDKVIPATHSRELCAAAAHHTYTMCHYVPMAGHNDLSLADDVCAPIRRFLDAIRV
jgi:pimeloyl-ACP methyl ester carboxylesterase